jgi:hypothetical protein
MTKDEIVKKNISLSFDFIKYIIKNPEILDKVSDGAEIEFFEPDLPMRTSEKRISDSAKSVFRVEHTFRQMLE